MSDEVELLRSLRPRAGNPTSEVITNEREHLMHFIAAQHPRNKRRRAATIAATIGISTIGLAGVAAAVGIVPDSVTNRFGALEERNGSIQIDSDQAAIVSSAVDGSDAIELWVAPAEGGRSECVYVRSLWQRSDGQAIAENGPVACDTSLLPWQDPSFEANETADYLSSLDVFAIGTPEDGFGSTAVTGAAHPDVTRLVLDMQDGQQLTVEINSSEGWFTVLIPGDVTIADSLGIPSNPVQHVTLLGADDQVIAELDDWPRYRAQPISDVSLG